MTAITQIANGDSGLATRSKLNHLITRVIDVTMAPFNATGDGVADDTTAIQAAIDWVGTANRGTIFFPQGTYKVISSLTFPYSPVRNISFIGDPGAKLIGSFNDAILKRAQNTPVSGVCEIRDLTIENNHATGTCIILSDFAGGASISNCALSGWKGVVCNAQSTKIDSCQITRSGSNNLSGSIGIMAGNANTILNCDIISFEHGVRHSNAGLQIIGGRFEVNTVGIMLGQDSSGSSSQSTSVTVAGLSMESNTTGIHCQALAGASIQTTIGGAQAGLAYGIRLITAQNVVFQGITTSSALGWSGYGISIEHSTDNTFISVAADTWNITGVDSFSMFQCNRELTVAELPTAARVGTILPVSNATATTVGSTVAGGGSNHVSVVRSAGVWRII